MKSQSTLLTRNKGYKEICASV